nr:reverse transcriptase domain-containing protein [Tanacetum cinerariifolium]
MADNRRMEELLQAPTEGYGKAIVIPEINADHFEIKTNLLQLVQAIPYHDFERENPYTHINNFKRITSTLKFKDVPNDATHLKNDISRFTERFEETFGEAWERFKEMLRACPHHGFMKLTQIDTFYNGLNENHQDSLNAAVGGNLLRRSFLRTGRALIDVYRKEITLRVNDEAVTFNLNQTTRYSSTYDDILVNRIDVIDVAREEYAQDMLGFSKNSLGGNPTPTSEPIIFDSFLPVT